MVDYTSLATLHGEVFTEKNPAFVKVLNELGINMKDLQPLIEAIISESGKTHDILNNQTNHSLNELDKTVKLFEKKFRRYIVDQENNGQGIHGNVTVDNLPNVQEVDGEVSINNLPNDYPDKDVKSELELIKQGVKENKETNQLILDRLDGTIDTQVTGSNVEEPIPTSLSSSNSVSEYLIGSSFSAGGSLFSQGIKYNGTRIGVGIRISKPTDIEVYLQPYAKNNRTAIGARILIAKETNSDRVLVSVDLTVANGALLLYNRGEEDAIIEQFSVTEFMSSGLIGGDTE